MSSCKNIELSTVRTLLLYTDYILVYEQPQAL